MSVKVKHAVIGSLIPRALTIGADPEFFIRDLNQQKIVSAHPLFPGTKAEPFDVAGGAIQVDGVALEVNVSPSESADEFIGNLTKTLDVATFMLKHQNPSLNIVVQPTATFSQEYFDALPDNVKELGCTPDFDCFNDGKVNDPPRTELPMRTGGGHIHIGWTQHENPHQAGHFFDCIKVAKQVAAAVYIPSHIWDKDQNRRSLYGKIGAFRPKSYGVESRFLSNAWVKSPKIGKWVFETVQYAVYLLDQSVELFAEPEFKKLLNTVPTDRQIDDYMDFLAQYGINPVPEKYV